MRAEAEKTIKLALDEGVIEKVPIDEPSEWLHRGFFVPKPNGKLHLVVDMSDLNKHPQGHFSDAVLQDLGQWMTKLINNILIAARDYQTLLKRLRMVLQRCSTFNLTISLLKLMIGKEVMFGGYLVSHKGIRPDPKAVEAVHKFPVPTDVGQLRSFTGFVNQHCIFRPDLSQMLHRLHQLLCKNTDV